MNSRSMFNRDLGDNVCNAGEIPAIQTVRFANPEGSRTKINYTGIILLYIDVVKSEYTIYRYFCVFIFL